MLLPVDEARLVQKYRKKPVEISAIQWLGHNWNEVCDFMQGSEFVGDYEARHENSHLHMQVVIGTLEGDMRANMGDYIIKGVKGEFYPCKPDIFEATYESVD